MPANGASIKHPHESWGRWLRRGVAAVVICCSFLALIYVLLVARQITKNATDIGQLQIIVQQMQADHSSRTAILSQRVDQLERVLFGDLVEKLNQPPPPNVPEAWQRNRDKELRDRILRLEEWRLRDERPR